MRLAVVTPFPPDLSGLGQYGWHLVRGLAATGRFERILVLAPRSSVPVLAETELPGVEVRRVWAPDDLRASGQLLGCLRQERPDLVWFNYGFTVFGRSRLANLMGMALPMVVREQGSPTAVTLHELVEFVRLRKIGVKNGRVTHAGGQMATWMLLQADAVCLTIRAYVERLQGRHPRANLHYVPHGAFDEPAFLPLPNPHLDILAFGFFAPFKGLPRLLEAYQRLQGLYPTLTLTIAGGDHARYPGYLDSLRREVGEAPGVRWLGRLSEPEVKVAFATASVVVLPYTATTGASSVLHRAATYGRPVIASDLPDLRAVAEEEDLRVTFVPPHGVDELTQALRELLADRSRREDIGRHNVRAMARISWSATSRRYADLFQAVLAQD